MNIMEETDSGQQGVTVNVNTGNFPDIDTEAIESLVRCVSRRFRLEGATVDISFVDDERMVGVNSRFLNSEAKTDVISFDLTDEGEPGRYFDLIINTDRARREAEKRGHSFMSETALYVLHGLLHQLGFDDLEPAEAEKMHEKEDEILQSAGFGITYRNRER